MAKQKMSPSERERVKFNNKQEKLDSKIKNESQKQDYKRKIFDLKLPTYTKKLVALITVVCLADLQLSYVLAFLDKVQIAEQLSQHICTTILGVAFVYMVRAYFDSKAEYGSTSPTIKKELTDIFDSKIKDTLRNAVGGVVDTFHSEEDVHNDVSEISYTDPNEEYNNL